MLRNFIVVAWLSSCVALVGGCPEEGKRRLGASCDADEECASGLCTEGLCLDPSADDDGDTLVNRIEDALGSSPLSRDSDGDGVDDAAELDASLQVVDSDGDGRADILESATADADGDCIVDQLDPDDVARDPTGCGPIGDVSDGDTTDGETSEPPADATADGDGDGPSDAMGDGLVADAIPDGADAAAADATAAGPIVCTTPAPIAGVPQSTGQSWPTLFASTGAPTLIMFQTFPRTHWAAFHGADGWSAPVQVGSVFDIDGAREDLALRRGAHAAYRASVVDGYGEGKLGVYDAEAGTWREAVSVSGLGAMAASFAMSADGTILNALPKNGGADLDLVPYTPAGGLGVAAPLARYTEGRQAFETVFVLDEGDDGAVISFVTPDHRIYGHAVRDRVPVGEAPSVGPTGAQLMSTGFSVVSLVGGDAWVLWTESGARLVGATFSHAGGTSAWSAPEVIHDDVAGNAEAHVDPRGDLTATFSSTDGLYGMRRVGGAWSEPVRLGMVGGVDRRPVHDARGFVWTSAIDNDIDYRVVVMRAAPGEARWTGPAVFERPDGYLLPSNPRHGLTSEGDFMIVWSQGTATKGEVLWATCR